MKKVIRQRTVGLLVLLAVLTFALASGASAAPASPFTGAWEADDIDGSHMRMVFGGGGRSLKLRWMDDGWSTCGGGANGLGKGTGVVDGADTNLLHVSWSLYCSGEFLFVLNADFVYNPGDNTFDYINYGGEDLTWTRIGR